MATAARVEIGPAGPTTAEELLAWPDAPPGEIVDGVWVPKYQEGEVTGTRFGHGLVALRIARLIANHVDAYRLGRTTASETAFRLRRDPDLVRCPDVGFVSGARLTAGVPRGVFEGAPDLAVEVLSPSNTAARQHDKVVDFLRYGTRAVWIVDTDRRTVAVHVAGALPWRCGGDDPLDGGDVLPEFSVPTSALFVDLDP